MRKARGKKSKARKAAEAAVAAAADVEMTSPRGQGAASSYDPMPVPSTVRATCEQCAAPGPLIKGWCAVCVVTQHQHGGVRRHQYAYAPSRTPAATFIGAPAVANDVIDEAGDAHTPVDAAQE